MTKILWVLQSLLALLFLFAGIMKFVMPMDQMTKQMPLPPWFLYAIGVAEIIGAIGLVLPSLLRVRASLTPLAAACLLIIMIGATVITLQTGNAAMAITPFVVCLLVAFVAYGRWRLAPIR
jgi:uncharacterized membrane protein YphA (DoxX/SURF4 family)